MRYLKDNLRITQMILRRIPGSNYLMKELTSFCNPLRQFIHHLLEFCRRSCDYRWKSIVMEQSTISFDDNELTILLIPLDEMYLILPTWKRFHIQIQSRENHAFEQVCNIFLVPKPYPVQGCDLLAGNRDSRCHIKCRRKYSWIIFHLIVQFKQSFCLFNSTEEFE